MLTSVRSLVAAGVAVVGALAAVSPPSGAQPAPRSLSVAAASDLQTVLPELAAEFHRETGVTARVSYGSSGNFFAQIQNGAPFDVFLSADIDYPRRLVESGHAEAASLYEYAEGRLVLWARKDAGLDVARGLVVLREARVRRVAIANPAHAPYGRAAVAALRGGGVYDAVRPKLVLGENISQTAQFVESGNADAGILALSLALGPALRTSGVMFPIPPSAHPPIRQAAVALTASQAKAQARLFLAYLQRPAARQLLERSGFGAPPREGPQ